MGMFLNLNPLAFVEKPAPDHYLLPLRDQSGNRFSLVAAGWLSIFRTHCVAACGREITPSPNPPRGRTTTTTCCERNITAMWMQTEEKRKGGSSARRLMKQYYECGWSCAWYSTPTLPGVSSAAPASACSSQAAGAPEHGSLSPWPLGCPTLDRDKHEGREREFCLVGFGHQCCRHRGVRNSQGHQKKSGRCPNAASEWWPDR